MTMLAILLGFIASFCVSAPKHSGAPYGSWRIPLLSITEHVRMWAKASVILGLSLALAGCGHRPLIPADFGLVTTNTTYQQLIKMVGRPDRGYGTVEGQATIITYEWDLSSPDRAHHYAMVVKVKGPPRDPEGRVQILELAKRPLFIDFSTNRGNQQGSHGP